YVDFVDEELHGRARGAFLTLEELAAVVRSPHLRSLTHLQLRCSNAGDAGIEEVIASGILKRLKVLDLRFGTVTDEGARALARCPDAAGLEMLDLEFNMLTDEGVEALGALPGTVRALPQATPFGDFFDPGDDE